MRKLTLLAALLTMLAARPAAACGSRNHCSPVLDVMALSIAAAAVGGYAYGTGYFAYHDLTDDRQTLKYGAAELAYNGTFAALAFSAASNARNPGPAALIGFGHGALAVHGAYRIHTEWRDPGHAPDGTREAIVGVAYGVNALVWTAGLGERHGRTYGIVEASVNVPVAVGFGYLAIDRARDGERGPALLYGGMAVLSGAFAYDGLRTAIDPPEPPSLDLLGTDVMPVAVSDGRTVAPGLGVGGTW